MKSNHSKLISEHSTLTSKHNKALKAAASSVNETGTLEIVHHIPGKTASSNEKLLVTMEDSMDKLMENLVIEN